MIDNKETYKGAILALDTASKNTGFAICKDGKLITSGVWLLKRGQHLKDLYNHITQAITQYNITSILAEDIYQNKDPYYKAAWERLAECRGVVELCSQQYNTAINFLSATKVRREVWGYDISRKSHKAMKRPELKRIMFNRVCSLGFVLNTDKDDESDAIGLLLAYLQIHNYKPLEPIR